MTRSFRPAPAIPGELLKRFDPSVVVLERDGAGDVRAQVCKTEEDAKAKGLIPVSLDAYLMTAGFSRAARRRIKTVNRAKLERGGKL